MGLEYTVEVKYLETGNLGGNLARIGGSITQLNRGVAELETGFGGAASAVAGLAVGIAGMAAAGMAGVFGLGKTIIGLNDNIEQTQIALAATFKANNLSASFGGGMTLAAEQIAKMRKDANDLPGEFQDLANIFQTIAPNTGRAGLNADQTRNLAANAMAAAAIARIPMHVAAREMSALIEGRSGAHNIMGLRLMGLAGDRAKEFNHKPIQERIALIQKELDRNVNDSKEAYKNSFVGLFSTLKDNIKSVGITMGAPLFEHVKASLAGINAWFSNNTGTWQLWAGHIGNALAKAWDYGMGAFEKWWGPVTTFFSTLSGEIHSMWSAIAPLVERVGNSFMQSLTNGEAVENLKSLAKLMLVMKVGSPLMGAIGGGLVQSASGGMGLGGMMGSGAAGLLGAGAATAALVALAAAAGESSALMNKDSEYHQQAIDAASNLSVAFDGLTNSLKGLMPSLEAFGVGATNFAALLGRSLTPDTQEQKDYLEQKSYDDYVALMSKNGMNIGSNDLRKKMHEQYLRDHPKLNPDSNPEIVRAYELGRGFGIRGMGTPAPSDSKPPPPPNHNTTIHKVELIVQTNQDPLRVARLAIGELAKLSKNPTSAVRSPNFMASR